MERGFVRCVICNAVSSEEIATDHGEYHPGAFILDKVSEGYLCAECSGSIYDVKTEWDIEDDLDYEFDPDEEFYFDE